MNYKLMLRTLGRTLQLEALCLLPPLVTALLYHEDPRPFVYTIVLVALLGTALSCLKAKPEFYSREGYAVVGLIWLTLSLFGALPFFRGISPPISTASSRSSPASPPRAAPS